MAEPEQKKESNEKSLEIEDSELAILALHLRMTRSPKFDPLFQERLRARLLKIVRHFPDEKIVEERDQNKISSPLLPEDEISNRRKHQEQFLNQMKRVDKYHQQESRTIISFELLSRSEYTL